MQTFFKKELLNKSAIAGFIDNCDLKTGRLAIQAELNSEQDKITKFKHFIHVISVVKVMLKIMKLKII